MGYFCSMHFKVRTHITILFALFTLLSFNSCNWWKGTTLYTAVPKSAIFVFESNNWNTLQNTFTETFTGSTVKELKFSKKIFSEFSEMVQILGTDASVKESLVSYSTILSIHLTSASDFGVLLNAPLSGINDNSLINKIQNLNGIKTVNIRVFKNQKIIDVRFIDGRLLTLAMLKGTICASFSSFLVENSVASLLSGESIAKSSSFSNCVQNKNKNSLFTAFVNFQKLNAFIPLFIPANTNKSVYDFTALGDWSVFDFSFSNDDIKIGGYSPGKTESTLLSYTVMQQIPDNAAIVHLSSDTGYLKNKISAPYFRGWATTPVALVNLNSLTTSYEKQNLYIVTSRNKSTAETDLTQLLKSSNSNSSACDTFENYPVYEIQDAGLVQNLFQQSFFKLKTAYFTVLDNCVLFAAKKEVLQQCIYKINAGEVLSSYTYTQPLSQCSNCKNSSVLYIQFENATGVFQQLLSANSSAHSLIQNSEYLLLANIPQKNHTVFDGILKMGARAVTNGAQKLWQTQLKAQPITTPIVTTKSDGSKIIFVQDTLLNLYALNASGEILFVKQMPEKIRGNVHVVDYYGNSTDEQFLFTTTTKIFLINSAGEDFANYPIRLSAPCTAETVVSSNRKRFFVPCNNGNLYGYEISGKPLAGFSPKVGIGELLQPLDILKHNGQEFIVANNTSGKLMLIAESGVVKWSLDNTYHFNALQQKNTFQVLSAKGMYALMVDAAGNDRTISLKDTAHFFAANLLNDSVLSFYVGNQNYVKWYDEKMNFKGAISTGAGSITSMRLIKNLSPQFILLCYDGTQLLCDSELKNVLRFDSQKFAIEQMMPGKSACLIEATDAGLITCRTLK